MSSEALQIGLPSFRRVVALETPSLMVVTSNFLTVDFCCKSFRVLHLSVSGEAKFSAICSKFSCYIYVKELAILFEYPGQSLHIPCWGKILEEQRMRLFLMFCIMLYW